MSETSGTYDCGVTCNCDAVTDLAAERTELMEEMAAALGRASDILHGAIIEADTTAQLRTAIDLARGVIEAALCAYYQNSPVKGGGVNAGG